MSIEELVKKYCTRWVHKPGINWTYHLTAALTEQAETHAMELRAYETTVQNLEQRIRELEAQRVPEGWSSAAQWLRNNYQDHPTISALCEAMLAAAPKKEGE